MQISLPEKLKITPVKGKENTSKIEIFPLYPGFGNTLGNPLRRVLLSSLVGAGITTVKIDGAQHEFMSLPHIKEEVLEIILNLKNLNFKLYTDGPEQLELSVKGKKEVTAKDFKANPNVEIANPDQLIATLTNEDADFNLEVKIEKGLGFRTVEDLKNEKEVGVIAIDTIFTPIRAVGCSVKNVRVGKRTDYDKLILNIQTDGTISAKEAINKAAKILEEQIGFLVESSKKTEKKTKKSKKKKNRSKKKAKKNQKS